MIAKSIYASVLILVTSCPVLSQNTDSLEGMLDTVQGSLRVKTLNELFRAHLASDPVTAVGYARRAFMLAIDTGDKRGMAAACNNLGVAYRNQGALDKALEYYIESLALYDSLHNREGIATTKNNMANIYAIKKDYDRAMRYLEESHALFRQMDDPFRLIGSMNNLGNLYQDLHMDEKALDYYTRAFETSEKNGLAFGDPMNNVGNIYFHRGDYQRAISCYEKALAIEKSQNNKLGILNTITNIGITHSKAGQPAKAEGYLSQAMVLSEALQALTSLPAIYKARAENFSIQGKWREAYKMQLQYDAMREQIHSEESSRNIAQMEMVVNFQQKERQIEILKKEDQIKSLELRNSRLFIVLVILGVIGIIGGVNLFYLDRKRKLIDR